MTPGQLQLIEDEGKVPHLYYVNGVPHIGIGCNLQANVLPEDICRQITIPESWMMALFQQQYHWALQLLLRECPWSAALDEVRLGVCVNILFNTGYKGFLSFAHMIAACHSNDWERASQEILNSLAAKQNPERYTRLARQMLTGIR